MTKVLYPGSFDPLHLGHLDIIEQSVALFGEVVVGVMHNPSKPSGMFSLTERMDMVRVAEFGGLAVDAALAAGVAFMVKGLRTAGDFEIEQQMAHTNHAVAGVRTVYLPCKPALVSISSRFIREVATYNGDVSALVPPPVAAQLARLFPAPDQKADA
jgi:pantetheine-phosphate adenylyltransferase